MARMLIFFLMAVAPEETHPAQPLLDLAEQRLVEFNRDVRTYQCIVHRKERVNGQLMPRQAAFLRVRQKPFSVYLKVVGGQSDGRELIWNPTRYGYQVIVHNGGRRFAFVTTALDPDSDLVRAETNHRVQDWGIAQGLETMIAILKEELKQPDVQVEYFKGAKVDGRGAFGAKITHPARRQGMKFYQALVLIDHQLRLPVYYQAVGWPQPPNNRSHVIEEFSFTRWQFNVSLDARHFWHGHSGYDFSKHKEFPYAYPGTVRGRR